MSLIPNFFGGTTSKPRKKTMRYKVVVNGTTIRKSSKKKLAKDAAKGIRGARVLKVSTPNVRRAKRSRRRTRRTTRRR